MQTKENMSSIRGMHRLAAGAAISAPSAAQAAAWGPLAASLSPWMLLTVPAVVGLWWLMKSIPKTRIRQTFPGITLLYNLKAEKQTPARMPWWQYIPVTLAAAATVGALSKPEWNPETPLAGSGPIIIAVDNSWPSARNWKDRAEQMQRLIDRAERAGRALVILPTAAPGDGSMVRVHGPMNAAEARQIVKEMKPHPWPANRTAALGALSTLESRRETSVIWLSDNLKDKEALPFARKLQAFGKLTVIEDDKAMSPRLIVPLQESAETLAVTVRRSLPDQEETIILTPRDESGNPLPQATAVFKAGETAAQTSFKLPPDIRNEIASITIEGDNTAGGRLLLDEQFRRRPVGVMRTGRPEGTHPLLDESHYVAQALKPYVDLHQGPLDDLMKRRLAVLVMTDSASGGLTHNKMIETWVRDGGTLLRFAGPRLAEQSVTAEDPLLPLKLRQGSHVLGTHVSGGREARLSPFPAASPFANIAVPGDVSVRQEVLPQPGADNDDNVWARLDNGTPLVTAKQHGKGKIVFVHTTADPAWSNLVYSGAFVEMMRAVVAASQGIAGKPENDMALPPHKIMDGQGRLVPPPPAVRPLTSQAITEGIISPHYPPGFYGNESVRQAHNLASAIPELKPMNALPADAMRKTFDAGRKDRDLTGYAWGSALTFLLLDLGIMLWQRRGFKDQAGKPKASPSPGN